MERRTWKDAAGPLVAILAGTAAAALVSLSSSRVELPGFAWMPDTTLRAQEPPPAGVRAYTNDDLERIRPLRGETGVDSHPAFARDAGACAVRGGGRRSRRPAPAAACATGENAGADATRAQRGTAARGEAYWRREAERVRDKLRVWRQQAEDLELKTAERRRKPGVRPYTDPQIVGWERRADALRARMRELEGDLDDRARRERALPGWLR